MTSLSGTHLVPKAHGRIAFRGSIDTLEAEVIEAQVLSASLGAGALPAAESECCGYLGEILDCLRAIMAAEVKGMPLPPPFLFGMDADEIRRASHDSAGGAGGAAAFIPSYTQGPLAARLNTLRAKVREAELLAVSIFGPRALATGEVENPKLNSPPNKTQDTDSSDADSANFKPADFDPAASYPADHGPGDIEPREDIILALNRLSSALWWLQCRYACR